MKPLGASRLLMPPRLEDLHHESITWISEGQFCLDELHFFDKLLTLADSLAKSDQEKDKLEHLLTQVKFYQKTALPRMIGDLVQHEKYLSGLMQRGADPDEVEAYRIAHSDHADNAREIYNQFKILKKGLYPFIESLIAG